MWELLGIWGLLGLWGLWETAADRGEAIFKGRIRVPSQAQLTDSGQLCRTVMLGERARVVAMPTLEISADNVECSHGASVADMDQNSLFYLASRGVDQQEARKLLLRGFVFDLLQGFILVSWNRISSSLYQTHAHTYTVHAPPFIMLHL